MPKPKTDAVLITQCLQRDFVKPIGPHEALPNLLHVGHDEALRLMGEDPEAGPVARTLEWAMRQPEDKLGVIHIRDWHDPEDQGQAEHLRQFGRHCVKDTDGAAFAFSADGKAAVTGGKAARIFDGVTLNDFISSDLADYLAGLNNPRLKVGIIGVWTEAKVTFLAYELRSRFPEFDLVVCSALTASSSRLAHFMALDQLAKILGVKVVASVGGFMEALGAGAGTGELPLEVDPLRPQLVQDGGAKLGSTDEQLTRYLFRDCKTVTVKPLTGGFSGNQVLATESIDQLGHKQVPHVVKIGPQDLIGRERESFERIEGVLGNNAPRITHFADSGGRGAIKYRYASMGGGSSVSFQKLYMTGAPMDRVKRILSTIFVEQLGRLYQAAEPERVDLLAYYGFRPDMAGSVAKRVKEVTGSDAEGETVLLAPRLAAPNVVRFYREQLPGFGGAARDPAYFAYVHGDLNGANIIVDGHENVWLIDFFHTHRGHVLKDLIKLENDLLYIFTPINDAGELAQAMALTELLLDVDDLAKPPGIPTPGALRLPQLARAYETAVTLRGFYGELIKWARDPVQLFIAQLRYAVHTLAFDECNEWQKRWALYTAGRLGELIAASLHGKGSLRIDWLEGKQTGKGRLGLTILPGRKDHARDLAHDLASLTRQGVTHVATLVSVDELKRYGVGDLLQAYTHAGLRVRHEPMADQGHCSAAEMSDLCGWIDQALASGGKVVLHCVGGLGRSGTVAASWLVHHGLSADLAMADVRRARSPRAVESMAQEHFVRDFAARRSGAA